MPRPAPAVKPKPVLIRFSPEVLATIDAHRGKLSRTIWVSAACLFAASDR